VKLLSLTVNLSLALFVASCASTPATPPAKVATPPVPSTQRKAPETRPAQHPITVDPLKDPNNILSHRNVYFDFDQSIIKNDSKDLIKAHAQYLTGHPDARLTLQGNCDERGSSEYNLALGQRRADAVMEVMTVLGASGTRIDTLSFGKEKPVCTEHDESCWWRNRRAEIVYQGGK
jgi:peptidoglycan-associated lipoprotein